MTAEPLLTGELLHHKTLIRAQLSPHEHLTWVGQPRPSRVIERGWIPILGSCFYLALVFWGLWYSVRDLPGGSHDPYFLPIIVIFCPFVFVGGFILTKPFRDISKATHLYYLITTHRAFILVHGKNTEMHPFSAQQIKQAEVHRASDGSGNIWFTHKNRRSRLHGFIGLEQVDQVLQYLEQIQPEPC